MPTETKPVKIHVDQGSDATSFPVQGDYTSKSARINNWVWDTGAGAWIRMQQPTIEAGDLYIAVDDVEQYILDQKIHFKLARLDTSGTPMYFGYLDKDSNWYIVELHLTDGTAKYDSGSSGFSTAWTNRATGSYDEYDTEF